MRPGKWLAFGVRRSPSLVGGRARGGFVGEAVEEVADVVAEQVGSGAGNRRGGRIAANPRGKTC